MNSNTATLSSGCNTALSPKENETNSSRNEKWYCSGINKTIVNGKKKTTMDVTKCSLCEFCTNNVKTMKLHKNMHKKKSKHECPLCSYSVAHYKNMADHLANHHIYSDEEESEVSLNKVKTRFSDRLTLLTCSICQYSSWKPRDIRRHQLQHTKKGTYQCSICSYSVNSAGILKIHMKRHHKKHEDQESLKSRLLKCDLCGYCTVYSTNLKKHKMGHLRNGKFKCHQCDFSSSIKTNIDFHMRNHHKKIFTSSEDSEEELNNNNQKRVFKSIIARNHGDAVRKCYVKLLDIYASSSPVLARTLKQESEKDDFDDISSETEVEASRDDELDSRFSEQEDSQIVKAGKHFDDIVQFRSLYSTHCFMENFRKKIEVEVVKKAKIDANIRLLRSRLEVMEKKQRLANDDLKKASSKKTCLDFKIENVVNRKNVKETELREHRIQFFELNLNALRSPDSERDEIQMKLVEENVKLLEKEVKNLEEELKVLWAEAEGVKEDLEEAEGSLEGILQIMDVLKSEMYALKSYLTALVGTNLMDPASLRKKSACYNQS